MGDIETVKVKHPTRGYAIINKSDYDPNEHKLYDKESKAAVAGDDGLTDEERDMLAKLEAKRKVDANRGVTKTDPVPADAADKNPSGTYSTPTPTDIRFPDKQATEFENNMGAFVGKSAADLRAERGLPDAPGGIKPVEIPPDWESMHWKQQVNLAQEISGQTDLDAAKAREIIATAVESKPAS
jgi:hypothetical protein